MAKEYDSLEITDPNTKQFISSGVDRLVLLNVLHTFIPASFTATSGLPGERSDRAWNKLYTIRAPRATLWLDQEVNQIQNRMRKTNPYTDPASGALFGQFSFLPVDRTSAPSPSDTINHSVITLLTGWNELGSVVHLTRIFASELSYRSGVFNHSLSQLSWL